MARMINSHERMLFGRRGRESRGSRAGPGNRGDWGGWIGWRGRASFFELVDALHRLFSQRRTGIREPDRVIVNQRTVPLFLLLVILGDSEIPQRFFRPE